MTPHNQELRYFFTRILILSYSWATTQKPDDYSPIRCFQDEEVWHYVINKKLPRIGVCQKVSDHKLRENLYAVKMVEWTDAERKAIASLWGKIDVGEIGPQALARLLIVYPWAQRYFKAFGDLSTNAAIMGKIDVAEIGPQALARLLIVYPWAQRYFKAFGDLSTNAAIMGNPKVAQHGKTVMGGLENAVKNLDNIKQTYAKLSVMHSEKLHVDPDNFRVLAECISLCVAAKFGPSVFTADVQEAWQKFLAVVVSALRRQYH